MGAAEPKWGDRARGQQRKVGNERPSQRRPGRSQDSPVAPGKKGHRLLLVTQQGTGDRSHSPCACQPWGLVSSTSLLCSCSFKNISKQLTLLSLFFTRTVETLAGRVWRQTWLSRGLPKLQTMQPTLTVLPCYHTCLRGSIAWCSRVWTLEPGIVGSNPHSATYWLCDLTSFFPSRKQG